MFSLWPTIHCTICVKDRKRSMSRSGFLLAVWIRVYNFISILSFCLWWWFLFAFVINDICHIHITTIHTLCTHGSTSMLVLINLHPFLSRYKVVLWKIVLASRYVPNRYGRVVSTSVLLMLCFSCMLWACEEIAFDNCLLSLLGLERCFVLELNNMYWNVVHIICALLVGWLIMWAFCFVWHLYYIGTNHFDNFSDREECSYFS